MESKLDKMAPSLYQYWDGVVRGTSGHTIRAANLNTVHLKAASLTYTTLTGLAQIAAKYGLLRASGTLSRYSLQVLLHLESRVQKRSTATGRYSSRVLKSLSQWTLMKKGTEQPTSWPRSSLTLDVSEYPTRTETSTTGYKETETD